MSIYRWAKLDDQSGPDRSIELTLDLLDLFDEDKLPMDDEETRQCMVAVLSTRLQAIPTGPGTRVVLVVTSIGLLARYAVGLREFYDWFCGDFSMVVLLRSEEHTSELQSLRHLVCRLLLEKKTYT